MSAQPDRTGWVDTSLLIRLAVFLWYEPAGENGVNNPA